jgi:thioredoxin reductase
LLCTGVIDVSLPLPGSNDLWGRSLFQCPYCHAYEVRGKRLGFLAPHEEDAEWVMLLRAWSRDVVLFTNGAFPCPRDAMEKLAAAGIPVEERRITNLVRTGEQLHAIEVAGSIEVPCDALFFRPTQRQVPVVARLGLALTQEGFVRIDDEHRTSHPKIYAAGDLANHYHGALAAADAGSQAAHCINHELTVELVQSGEL